MLMFDDLKVGDVLKQMTNIAVVTEKNESRITVYWFASECYEAEFESMKANEFNEFQQAEGGFAESFFLL